MKATKIKLKDGTLVTVYAGSKVLDALTEITKSMPLYDGVRLTQVLEAVYNQGLKDGARNVFSKIEDVKKAVPHRKPGRPRLPKKA